MAAKDVVARLYDVRAAAQYLGNVSPWTVRAFVAAGHLQPVRLPSVRRPGEVNRRLLFAKEDLDALVDQWKRASSSAPNAQLSEAAVKGWRQTPARRRSVQPSVLSVEKGRTR